MDYWPEGGITLLLVSFATLHHNLIVKKFVLQPFHLAWLLGGFWTILFILLFPWLTSVFRGDVLLNQNLISLQLDSVTFFGSQIPFSDFSIRFYSVFVLIAFFAGYALSLFLVRRSFLPETLIDRLIIGIVLFGLLGARAFYVIFNIPAFFGNVTDLSSFLYALLSTFLIYEGGLAITGGILGALGYIYWYTRVHKFTFLEVTDLLVPGLLLGQIIGRWGNFFNYEAYGGPTNVYWKMFVPESAVNGNKYQYTEELARYFHPTFLYEMLPNILLLCFILFNYKRFTARSAGLVTALYLMCYGAIRFVTEFFRLDALVIPWSIPVSFPSNIANMLGGLLPTGIREPTVFWLQGFTLGPILVSQLFALVFVGVGIWLYNRRSGVIYSPEKNRDSAPN